MQRRMTRPTSSHGISKTMPDVSGYAAAHGLEGKSDDEIRDAMGGTTAQKTFDQSGARCLKVVKIAQTSCSTQLTQLATEGSDEWTPRWSGSFRCRNVEGYRHLLERVIEEPDRRQSSSCLLRRAAKAKGCRRSNSIRRVGNQFDPRSLYRRSRDEVLSRRSKAPAPRSPQRPAGALLFWAPKLDFGQF